MKVKKAQISDYYIPRLHVHNAGQILMGTFTEARLKTLKSKPLEVTLRKLIKFADINRVLDEGSGLENHKAPAWWPADQPFRSLDVLKRRSGHSKKWITLLRHLTASSINFYNKFPVDIETFKQKRDCHCKTLRKNTGRVFKNKIQKTRINLHGIFKLSAKKEQNPPRSPLKENNSLYSSHLNNNQLHFKSSPKLNLIPKPKTTVSSSDEDIFINNSYSEPSPNDSAVDLSIHKHLQLTPIIKLSDILRPVVQKPVLKDDFMGFLNLQTSTECHIEKERTPPPESMKYSSLVPFSSDLGRILLNKDRYKLARGIYERKTEKLNYYLKEMPLVCKDKEFEVFCNLKKHECGHFYKFPNRKHIGDKSYVQLLDKTFCRPVSVKVVRLDVDKYFYKKYKCKGASVVLERLLDS